MTPGKLYNLKSKTVLANMRHLARALRLLWIALTPVAQSTQNHHNNNDDAIQTDSVTTPIRLADIQQCPTSPKPGCGDPNCQGARHQCATQYLCSSESPFADPSSPSSSRNGRLLILAGCRCCPPPIHVECTNVDCAAPSAGSRVCAAEPLRGCACQTADDRVRAARERTAGWVWPLDKNDEAFDPDIESGSSSGGDEDGAGGNGNGNSNSSAARGVSSGSGPVATMPALASSRGYFWAMDDQLGLKFLL